MKIGVPFDVAHAMNPDEALVYQIIAGQLEGGDWDWDRMSWRDPN